MTTRGVNRLVNINFYRIELELYNCNKTKKKIEYTFISTFISHKKVYNWNFYLEQIFFNVKNDIIDEDEDISETAVLSFMFFCFYVFII